MMEMIPFYLIFPSVVGFWAVGGGGGGFANLSLRWAHNHFVGFVMSRLIYTRTQISKIHVYTNI